MITYHRALLPALALFIGPVAIGQADPTPVDPQTLYASRSLEPQDVARVLELYHLADLLGEELWPGFDTREIPIAVNHDDRAEMLFAHPHPPAEFEPSEVLKLEGRPLLVRDGSTRYGPRGGGWAVDLGGERTAYVSTLQPGQSIESYLSLLLHECFHVYQSRFQARVPGAMEEPPEDDAVYSARIGLESRVLRALLASEDEEERRQLGRQLVAVRHARRAGLSEAQIRTEGLNEYNEGTATYVQARLYELLIERGSLEPLDEVGQTDFSDAEQQYQNMLARIEPPSGQLIAFFHSQYQNGMAMCLALDRLRPGWKQEMSEPGRSQFDLIERALEVDPGDEAELVAAAEERFGYAELLEQQNHLLEERLATIRGYLEASGRHYRIHHSKIRGRFNWKPAGPVYRVPTSLLPDEKPLNGGMTVWAGGILHFEKGDLDFDGQAVPMIFRHDWFEWIDPEPAEDESDLRLEFREREEDVYHDLRLTTDGFTLAVPKARIVRTAELVDIIPLVE